MLICNTYMFRRNAIANLQYLWAMLQGIQEYIHTVNWQYSLCLPTTLGAGELLLATWCMADASDAILRRAYWRLYSCGSPLCVTPTQPLRLRQRRVFATWNSLCKPESEMYLHPWRFSVCKLCSPAVQQTREAQKVQTVH